jgi:Ca2+-binding EF-hand superfamily protein
MPPRIAALCLVAAAIPFAAVPALAQTRPAATPARPAPAAASPLARTTFLTNMNQQFLKIDADKNGQITAEEAAAFARVEATAAAAARNAALFRQLDADRNGQISAAEFRRLVQPVEANGQKLIQANDVNRDGRVTLVEYRTTTLANFDKIDTDKDGVVTPAEMKAAGIGR